VNDLRHVKGLSALNKFMQQLPVKYEKNVLRGAVRAGAKPIQEEIKATIWEDTGELKRGVKTSTESRGGRVRAKVKATGRHAFIANFLEFGVAAHRIASKVGGWLSFGGVFSRSVEHPGIQPRPVFRPALDRKATAAVVAAAEYSKKRLASKHGLDTADIEIEAL
jgi:HK97 gp10 family phage protein